MTTFVLDYTKTGIVSCQEIKRYKLFADEVIINPCLFDHIKLRELAKVANSKLAENPELVLTILWKHGICDILKLINVGNHLVKLSPVAMVMNMEFLMGAKYRIQPNEIIDRLYCEERVRLYDMLNVSYLSVSINGPRLLEFFETYQHQEGIKSLYIKDYDVARQIRFNLDLDVLDISDLEDEDVAQILNLIPCYKKLIISDYQFEYLPDQEYNSVAIYTDYDDITEKMFDLNTITLTLYIYEAFDTISDELLGYINNSKIPTILLDYEYTNKELYTELMEYLITRNDKSRFARTKPAQ